MRRRASRTSRLLLLTGVALSAAAGISVNAFLRAVEARAPAIGRLRPVVVAARDLAEGTVLDPSMLEIVDVPDRWRQPGSLGSTAPVYGRTLLAPVSEGEAIADHRIGPAGAGPVASRVPLGFLAVTVPVLLPPGTVVPGDRVDVIATFSGPKAHTETVAERAEILRLGNPLTLLVSAADASDLAYASSFADLAVAVVPPA